MLFDFFTLKEETIKWIFIALLIALYILYIVKFLRKMLKKTKLVALATLILGIAFFTACSDEGITSENSNNSEVLNKSLVEDLSIEDENFFSGISFEGIFDNLVIFKDFSVQITDQESAKDILLKYIEEGFEAFNENSLKILFRFLIV